METLHYEKTAMLSLINYQSDINKTYLYTKDPYETNINFQLKNVKNGGIKHLNNHKLFIEYSNDMQDVYKTIEE